MKIFDAHCDVLYKMNKDTSIDFNNSSILQANYQELIKAGVKVQCFAIFVSPDIPWEQAYNAAISMVSIFNEKIIKGNNPIRHIKSKKDISELKKDELGAILTLEGCDSIGSDINKLRHLLDLGVSSVGLTWNFKNAAADGAMEKQGAGLSEFGVQIVKELNRKHVWCDVSHLSEKGFWDVMELSDYPFASHSNSYKICPHPRNLSDDQLKALIRRDSVVGLTFVPHFLSTEGKAEINDILRHLDHVCSLGGENHVGFGSDFDGIEETVNSLASMGDYENLINELLKNYSNIQVQNFLFANMEKRFPGR